MKEIEKGFTQGVVYAVSLCLRWGEDGAGELIWNESNFSIDDLKVCDNYDARVVKKYFRQQAVQRLLSA